MSSLAIFGGPKTIEEPFPPFCPIGPEEEKAAVEVIRSGRLSGFLASWGDGFLGGEKVKELEREWANLFETKNAVAFNSWTSGLVAAVGAIGVEPGDEIIVSPWTMSASATAILAWNAIPVFADIDQDTFNLDPASVERCITPRTKAIMVPDIFGQAADLDRLMEIAAKNGLMLVEDAAQSPLALSGKKYAGTIGHIGGYSLNFHKHIHTGEGGVAVTDDPGLAERMQLIRNHAEAVVEAKGTQNLCNMIGFNLRLGEIEAAMALSQLKKLPAIVEAKAAAGKRLTEGLSGLNGLQTPVVKSGNTHAYYIYGMRFNSESVGVSRETVIAALQAEGVPWVYGGYQLLHLLPMYQHKIAYGTKGFPWNSEIYKGDVSYELGSCPVAERLHFKEVICLQIGQHDYTDQQTDLVINCFHKVWENLNELKGYKPV